MLIVQEIQQKGTEQCDSRAVSCKPSSCCCLHTTWNKFYLFTYLLWNTIFRPQHSQRI